MIEILKSLIVCSQFDEMTVITEQDIMTINLLESFMTSLNTCISSYVQEIDRLKQLLFELQ